MIFNKITNEYKKGNTAVKDFIYKICGITVCHIKDTTTNASVVQGLSVVRKNKRIKGFGI